MRMRFFLRRRNSREYLLSGFGPGVQGIQPAHAGVFADTGRAEFMKERIVVKRKLRFFVSSS